MNDIPLGDWNKLTQSIPCAQCQELMAHADELVFVLRGEVVFVSERHPDWDKAYCNTCAEELNMI